MKTRALWSVASVLLILMSAIGIAPAAASSAGLTSQVPSSGTTSLTTGEFTPSDAGSDVTQAEFPGQVDEAVYVRPPFKTMGRFSVQTQAFGSTTDC